VNADGDREIVGAKAQGAAAGYENESAPAIELPGGVGLAVVARGREVYTVILAVVSVAGRVVYVARQLPVPNQRLVLQTRLLE
jgi:hypothetical protein